MATNEESNQVPDDIVPSSLPEPTASVSVVDPVHARQSGEAGEDDDNTGEAGEEDDNPDEDDDAGCYSPIPSPSPIKMVNSIAFRRVMTTDPTESTQRQHPVSPPRPPIGVLASPARAFPCPSPVQPDHTEPGSHRVIPETPPLVPCFSEFKGTYQEYIDTLPSCRVPGHKRKIHEENGASGENENQTTTNKKEAKDNISSNRSFPRGSFDPASAAQAVIRTIINAWENPMERNMDDFANFVMITDIIIRRAKANLPGRTPSLSELLQPIHSSVLEVDQFASPVVHNKMPSTNPPPSVIRPSRKHTHPRRFERASSVDVCDLSRDEDQHPVCKKRLRLDDDNTEAVACVADSTNSDDDTRPSRLLDYARAERMANKNMVSVQKIYAELRAEKAANLAAKNAESLLVKHVRFDVDKPADTNQ